jgi:hypothetical protein
MAGGKAEAGGFAAMNAETVPVVPAGRAVVVSPPQNRAERRRRFGNATA